MQKSKIEWTDYTVNPVKGLCPMACSYCYARRMYKRFGWNETIRFDGEAMCGLPKKPSRIFVGSTMELFGKWVLPEWLTMILEHCQRHPEHTFIFLTKQPQNLPREFPPNCWVGVSVPRSYDDTPIGYFEAFQRIAKLGEVKATIRFVSLEPLLESVASEFDFGLDMAFKAYKINWIIIGQQTPVKASTQPKVEWIREIVEAADRADIPVFLKDNLWELLVPPHGIPPPWARGRNGQDADILRQEFPKVGVK